MKVSDKIIPLAILAGLTAATPVSSQPQDIRIERLTMAQGLSQGSIFAILQDHKGFVWVGTQDGLNKYDGNGFQVFRHDPQDSTSLSNNWISALYEDRSQTIWVGTGNGLNRLDRGRERFIRYLYDPKNPQGLSWRNVTSIYEDRFGTLWVGAGKGLNRLDRSTGTFRHYFNDPNNPNSLSDNRVRVICEDRYGDLWIGTANGLNQLDRRTETFTRYFHDSEDNTTISDNSIGAIYEDHLGTLWIGTNGLNRFDRESRTFVRYQHDPNNPTSLSHDWAGPICEDSTGTLWIGTPNGLNRFNRETESFTRYHHQPGNSNSLSYNLIVSLFAGHANTLWVGALNGLNRIELNPSQFVAYRHEPNNPNSLNDNFVYSVYEDREGILWIGTFGQGLNKFEPHRKKFKLYKNDPKNPKSLSHDQVVAIHEDRFGILWVGTTGGLNAFDRNTEIFTRYLNNPDDSTSLSGNITNAIMEDSRGALWIGTNRGLNRFDHRTGTFKRYLYLPEDHPIPGLSDIRAIHEAANGIFWLATVDGLIKFDPASEKFVIYRNDEAHPNLLTRNGLITLCEGKTGALWLGTSEGLNRFDPKTAAVTHYYVKDGLPNNFIYGILCDDRGRLWISTNKGLSCFDDRLPSGKKFKNYDAGDGLQGDEFNQRACFKNKNGELFFGGTEGLTRFHPDRIHDNPRVPPVVLTAFKKYDRRVLFDRDISEVDNIELDYTDKAFSFEFAALNYTNSGKNQYAYKLEGFDQDWIYCGNRRVAYFTNLDPGNYVFRAKGSNNDGVWNEKGLTLKIKIHPPFWATWWFRILSALAAIGIPGLIYERRVSGLRRAKAAQEEFSRRLIATQEAERQRIAFELHDSLGQNLLIIKNGLQQFTNTLAEQGQSPNGLDDLSDLAQTAINETREIACNLHPHQLDRLGLKKAMASMINKMAQSAALQIAWDIDEIDGLFPKEAEINLFRLVQEGLNNIVKHAAATAATIQIKKIGAKIAMAIADNGKGFDANLHSANPAARKGFGLAGMAERTRILGGNLVIDSAPEKGTTLEIVIPIAAAAETKQ